MKLKERFVLRSKEADKKEAALRKRISLFMLFSAVVIPLLNDGVLYTVIEYTSGDAALTALNLFLRYVMIIIRYACIFTSYAAGAAGVLMYGYRDFKTPPVFLLTGTFLRYMVAQFGSLVFCYEHDVINSAATDIAAMGLGYFLMMTLDLVMCAVLLVIGCRYAKKLRDGKLDQRLPDCSDLPENGAAAYVRAAFSRRFPVARVCLFTACVHTGFDIVSNFLSVTLTQLASDGLPSTLSQAMTLLSGYVLIVPLCAAGFFLAVLLCFGFCVRYPEKKS